MLENNVLKQHYEFYFEMQKEREALEEEFNLLKKEEGLLLDGISKETMENNLLDNKASHLERNVTIVNPEKVREINEKIEAASNTLKSKDGLIEQLL